MYSMEREHIETEFFIRAEHVKRSFKENILYSLRHCHLTCPITMLQSLEFIAAMTLFKFQYKIRFSNMTIQNSRFKLGKTRNCKYEYRSIWLSLHNTKNLPSILFETLAQFLNYCLLAWSGRFDCHSLGMKYSVKSCMVIFCNVM